VNTTNNLSLPSRLDIETALASQRELAAFVSTKSETQRIHMFDEKDQPHVIELPSSVVRLLVDILAELAEGNAVRVMPVHAEVTTQEAADLLNVSRPYLVKLVESGQLRFHKTGKHRRIRFADLMEYKAKLEAKSEAAMSELVRQAQEHNNLGYE